MVVQHKRVMVGRCVCALRASDYVATRFCVDGLRCGLSNRQPSMYQLAIAWPGVTAGKTTATREASHALGLARVNAATDNCLHHAAGSPAKPEQASRLLSNLCD